MRRNLVLGLMLFGILGLAWMVAAQDDPAKPVANPFDAGAKVEPAKKRSAVPVIKLAQPFGPEATLEERLQAKASFEADEVPLKEFVEALGAALDKSVVLATKKLEEAAINLETPVTFGLRNVKTQTALRLILGELGLTYLTYDDVLMITTPEDAGSQLVTRVYDCRELLKAPSFVTRRPLFGGGLGGGANSAAIPNGGKADDAAQSSDYSADELLEIIETTVHPDSWFDGNNNHSADFKGLLIILQSQEMHADIEKLLNQLHNACGIEKKVKVFR